MTHDARDVLPFDGIAPDLEDGVFVAPGAKVIGDVKIGAGTGVWYGCVIRGDVNEIRIGRDVNIQDGTIIHVATHGQGTYIGDRVSIGHMALIHACTLEDEAFVGMKAVVMDGAVVESGAMVAAGALVTPGKRVRKGELWTGAPAKCARSLTEKDLDMMRWTHTHYVGLARKHAESIKGGGVE